jgi:hypothetical protein
MEKKDSNKKMLDFEARFMALPDDYKGPIQGAMIAMTQLGAVAGVFRDATGDDRKVAESALDFLAEIAPTRHKKEIAAALRNAVTRYWTEKDNNMLPVEGETPTAH